MATANMILRTWTGEHDAVVHYEPASRIVLAVSLVRDGAERDITASLDDATIAEIEAQLTQLDGDTGLDLEAADAEVDRDTGEPAPDEGDEVSRRWLEDEQREASE